MLNSSQHFIPISDISNDLVFLKNGGVTMVITISAVNFGLLFETEQMSIIESFAGFLNSLSFPIQIVIHSRRLDVSTYLQTLDKALATQPNPLLKNMTIRYRDFVASIIKEKNVLDKQFYVCLSINPAEIGVFPKSPQDKTKRATTILSPRRDHLVRQLSRLGLKAKQLTTPDLVKLFYHIYNPIIEPSIPEESTNSTSPKPEAPSVKILETSPAPPQPINQPHPTPPVGNSPTSLPSSAPSAMAHPIPPATSPLSPPFVVEELNDDFGP